jgi:tRNA(Ile)-lysidine synthase TilS/MesJ
VKPILSYERFVQDNEPYLLALRNQHVYMAYTGGKDASVILHYFTRAREEFGFEFETLAAMFPVHCYPQSEVQKLDTYWASRGVKISWHTVPVDDSAFNIAKEQGTNPCEVCHDTKRSYFLDYLNRTVTDWNSVAIILGFTLWDIASYTLEYQLGKVFATTEALFQGETMQRRFFRTTQRFFPVLKMKEGYNIYKPLLRYNDQEITTVITENAIPIQTTVCQYKGFRPKRLFAESYLKMDYYFDYDKVMKFAKESMNLEQPSTYEKMDRKDFITSIL